jgi:hypothetical protein
MARMIWEVEMESSQHLVEMRHSYITGRCVIRVDGEKVVDNFSWKKAFLDTGGVHTFEIQDHEGMLHIVTDAITFDYRLYLDGVYVAPKKRQGAPSTYSLLQGVVIGFGILTLILLIAMSVLTEPGRPLLSPLPENLRAPARGFFTISAYLYAGYGVFMLIIWMSRSRSPWLLIRPLYLIAYTLLFLANSFRWVRQEGALIGVIQGLDLDMPNWVLFYLILPAVALLLVAWNPSGLHHVLFLLNAGLLLIGLFALQRFPSPSQVPDYGYDLGVMATTIFGIVGMIISLATLFFESWVGVPLSSPIGRFIYAGRWRKFANLVKWAEDHGWKTEGPGGRTSHHLILRGEIAGRAVFVSSDGSKIHLGADAAALLYPFILGEHVESAPGSEDVSTIEVRTNSGDLIQPKLSVILPKEIEDLSWTKPIIESAAENAESIQAWTPFWTETNLLLCSRKVKRIDNKEITSIERALQWMVRVLEHLVIQEQ